jgi:hypothetical protein
MGKERWPNERLRSCSSGRRGELKTRLGIRVFNVGSKSPDLILSPTAILFDAFSTRTEHNGTPSEILIQSNLRSALTSKWQPL